MTSEDFRNEWARFHASRRPMGWMLRQADTLPWVRFHALPDSQRYANNDAERDVILGRANEIGDHLLGDGEPCWMIQVHADQVDIDDGAAGILADQFADDDDPDDPMIWRIFVTPVTWKAKDFDSILTEIADDAPFFCLWMARNTGVIFAPYDGGFDLFPAEFDQVNALKAKWPNWLSTHASGL